MEHSIDLAACHFIQAVAPSSKQKIVKKIKCAFEEAAIEDTVNLDALDAHLAGFDLNGNFEEEDGDEQTFDTFDIADSIGKALSLVKQVSLDIACNAGLDMFTHLCFRSVRRLRRARSS
jgi:hypothetical protein